MMRRVLVTGGAGFIGSHVADLFVANGWDVTIVDDLSSGKRENLPEKAHFHEISVTSREFVRVVGSTKFDVVAHLSGQIGVRTSVDDREYAALRLCNVYGPRQDPNGEAGVVAIFCGRIINNRSLTVFGDGHQTRDYVYVGDAARAFWLAATKPLPEKERLDGRSFNIGTGKGTTVLEIGRLLQEVAGTDLPIEFTPRRPGEQQRSLVNADKARELLGWSPQTTLADGLAKTYEWFARQRKGVAV